uniref:Uncharacterized protein n=1 Tax=Tanacetum cinerariifolium TaxID=118510 RepID=A0A699J361_TANCI|nr:hypothetical protein [Tanacetum cinerariifolium]
MEEQMGDTGKEMYKRKKVRDNLVVETGEFGDGTKERGATQLEPSWPEAWVTLGRAQLNFGEPDSAIESFDKALAIKPNSVEAKEDRKTALHLVKKRKQLHSSGLNVSEKRKTGCFKMPF